MDKLRQLSVQFCLLAIIFFLCSFIFVGNISAEDTPTPSPSTSPTPSSSDNPTPTSEPTSNIGECVDNNIKDPSDCYAFLKAKRDQFQSQADSLTSAISVMQNQINLTQLKIDETKQQIADLTSEIAIAENKVKTLSKSLDDITKVLMNRIVATYKFGSVQPLSMLLSADSVSNLLTRANYLRIAQSHDRELIFATQQTQNDYANQKNIFQDKKQQVLSLNTQLQSYSDQISQEKSQKDSLLVQTQGSEANYEKLVEQAKAQLEGFSGFATSQGGATPLSDQTYCDSWGCYYNQRDSSWGSIGINKTSYSIADDGCLMTSVAMVLTHYGHKTTPLDINNNPGNFASYEPAYLMYTISVNGITAQRVGTVIDSTLNDGNNDPVIVGIQYPNSPDTHFVVLKSGSNGNYIMDDPFVPNGHDKSFTEHYSMSWIYEIDKVNIL